MEFRSITFGYGKINSSAQAKFILDKYVKFKQSNIGILYNIVVNSNVSVEPQYWNKLRFYQRNNYFDLQFETPEECLAFIDKVHNKSKLKKAEYKIVHDYFEKFPDEKDLKEAVLVKNFPPVPWEKENKKLNKYRLHLDMTHFKNRFSSDQELATKLKQADYISKEVQPLSSQEDYQILALCLNNLSYRPELRLDSCDENCNYN